MADYDVVANTAGVHIAGLSRESVVIGVGVPGLLSVIIIVLILIGLLLTGIAVWMLRTTEPESVTLGPLSVMGRKRWRTADPDTQRRELEAARPLGADGSRSGTDDRSDAKPDLKNGPDGDADGRRSGGDDDVTRSQAAVRRSSKRAPKRSPKRYLAGDEPDGIIDRDADDVDADVDDAARAAGGRDDTRAELGRLADSGRPDFDDDESDGVPSRMGSLWEDDPLSSSNDADVVAIAGNSVTDPHRGWEQVDEVDEFDDADDELGVATGAEGHAGTAGRSSNRAVFRARRRSTNDQVGASGDNWDGRARPDPEYDVDDYAGDDYAGDEYAGGEYADGEYVDQEYAGTSSAEDYADGVYVEVDDVYVEDGYDGDDYDEDGYDDRVGGYRVGRDEAESQYGDRDRDRFELGEYDPYDEAMGLTPQPRRARTSRRFTATRGRRGGRDYDDPLDDIDGDDIPAAEKYNAGEYDAGNKYDVGNNDDSKYDDVDHEHENTDMEYQQDNLDDRSGSASDPFFDDDFDGSWDQAPSTGRPKADAARRSTAQQGERTSDERDTELDESPSRGRGRRSATGSARRSDRSPSNGMTSFDPDALVDRFRERAAAVRRRPLPPVAGEERQEFIRQAKIDYQDFAMIGDAEVSIEDGVLVMRVDLRGQR